MVLPVLPFSVAQAYEGLRNQGLNTKNYLSTVAMQIAAVDPVDIDSQYFLSAIASAANTIDMATSLLGNAALAAAFDAYVREQVGDSGLDVHQALIDSMTALAVCVSAMVADVPKDANGFLLDRKFDAHGRVLPILLPVGSLSGSAAAIDAWLATIGP